MNTSTALDLVTEAQQLHRAIGAFNVVLLEHAEAIVEGAERAGLPVILQISQNAARYHGSFEPIATASLAIAREAGVPAIVHLDHAEDVALVHAAVELGVQSVMFDGSALPYDVNVATTREVRSSATIAGSSWRRSWARSAAKTACMRPARAPGPTRPPRSSRPRHRCPGRGGGHVARDDRPGRHRRP